MNHKEETDLMKQIGKEIKFKQKILFLPTRHIPITHLLQRSIADQIEATILRSPECSRTASLRVDRLLLCSDRIGGHN